MSDDAGQATVEFALILPVVTLAMLALLYVALVIRADLRVHEAAREAVRAASLDPDPIAARAASDRIAPGAAVSVTRSGVGEPVSVTVSMSVAEHVPLISALVPAPTVRATALMRAER